MSGFAKAGASGEASKGSGGSEAAGPMSVEEKRGHELMKDAEKALTRFSWFGLANSTKTEDAIALYVKAANNFKIAQRWQLAGDAYHKCAELDTKIDSAFEASNHYVAAAEMYTRVDPATAIGYYQNAVTIMCENGRFGAGAKNSEAVADLYEKDNNLQEAMKFYQQAANYYNADNSPSRSNKNLEKVATIAATLADYKQATEIFDKLGSDSLNNNLLKHNAKKHFLNAGICFLARGDYVAAKNALQRFGELDYTFSESRQGKLFAALIECCEAYDIDKFADELYRYDTVSKLTPWETSILLRVKNSLAEEGEEAPDLQ